MDINKGIELFNNEYYFEAHDFFEDIWAEDRTEAKKFYQGLVQISVGSFHLINRNYQGAFSQLKKGVEKLNYFPDFYGSIDLLKFRQDINYLIEQISLFYSKKNYKLEVLKITFTNKL